MSRRGVLGLVGAGVLVLLGGGALALTLWARAENTRLEQRIRAALEAPLRRHLDAFRADLQALSGWEVPPLPGTGPSGAAGRDAARFLASRIHWVGGPKALADDLRRWNAAVTAGGPTLPDAVLAQLARRGDRWLEPAREVSTDRLDFAWMATLETFDTWDLDAAGPGADRVAADPTAVDPLQLPVPAVPLLAVWGRLRLLRGLQEPDPTPAFRAVRALARLLHSTEWTVGALVALQVLDAEHEAYRWLEGRRRAPAGWAPVPLETLARARRVLRASGAFVHLLAPDDAARAFLEHPAPYGLCPALRTGLPMALALRAVLSPALPEAYARLDAALARSRPRCRLSHLRALWATAGYLHPAWRGTQATLWRRWLWALMPTELRKPPALWQLQNPQLTFSFEGYEAG